MPLHHRIVVLLAALMLCLQAWPQQQKQEMKVELSPLVTRLLEDDLLSDEQRRQAMIFHGQWDDLGELTAQDQLRLKVARHESLIKGKDANTPLHVAAGFDQIELNSENVYLLSQGALQTGELTTGINVPGELKLDWNTPTWRLHQARFYEDTGQYKLAIEKLTPLREQALKGVDTFTSAPDLTAASQAVVMLARLEGRPAADFHLANQLLAKARDEMDPLYWPAYVAEAELLMSKGNPQQAMEAITQALSLNPKSSEAWYLFGSMRTRFFDFDSADNAVKQLKAINEKHPLGKALAVEIALRQKDVGNALKVIESALEDYPTHRKLLALSAATHALNYDVGEMDAALATFSRLAPGNPLAQFYIGRTMNDARQYKIAEAHLKSASEMMPGWSEPQLALGQLYMDWGKLNQAATQLQAAASLDPFHKAITNQLVVVNDMLGYKTLETQQFLVRYQSGVDEVLARDMKLQMGTMVEAFIKRFGHDPPGLTQVDLMPDDEHFAVRLTGMPDIWTIAACTGDVIAMTPPRPGPKRAYGAYNWLNVMGHEYVHVVNLSQTGNRVPHWFTEGCAVRMETTGRLWSQYTLLADCYNNDKLFEYDEINWGFIRPTEDYHRSLAYAQSAWIMQYIEEEHGWDKALKMLELYKQGVGEHDVIKQVFGVAPDAFMKTFLEWAGKQVQAWGMATYGTTPEDEVLADLMSPKGAEAADIETLRKAAADHPEYPSLLKILAEKIMLQEGQRELALETIKRYRELRPVDPWADRQLARLALQAGQAETAIASLRTLDRLEGDAPEYAVELARVYRSRKDFETALHFAERALLREPYNATYRETAAALCLQHGDLERAAFHVESLEILEPDRSMHPKRLAVIYERLGRDKDAEAARKRAK